MNSLTGIFIIVAIVFLFYVYVSFMHYISITGVFPGA